MRRWIEVGLVLFMAAVACPAPIHAQSKASDAAIRSTIERLAKSKRYQTELPVPERTTPPRYTPPNIRMRVRPPDRMRVRPPDMSPGADAAGSFMQILLWGFVGVVLLFLLVPLAMRLIEYLRARRAGPIEADENLRLTGGAPAAANDPISRARALAAEGKYAKAVHLLLLHGIAMVQRQDADTQSDALTSREIVRKIRLRARIADALAVMVRAVEISRFGDRDPGPEEFERCCVSFADLEATMQGSNG
jgi:hypothetical protein